MAGRELEGCIRRLITDWLPYQPLIAEAFYDRRKSIHPNGRLILVDANVRLDALLPLEAEERRTDPVNAVPVLYAVRGKGARWSAFAIEKRPGSFETRVSFPRAWCGLRDTKLDKATGIPGCRFVHASGFFAVHTTWDGIMAMIEKSLAAAGLS
jgi:uncharacterized UPF0160 family protein